MPGLVGVLVVLGAVVVVPLGLARLQTAGVRHLRRPWPVLGLLVAVALLLPRGPLAVALVLPYAAACAVVTGCGALRLRQWAHGSRTDAVAELVAFTAAGSLSVAGLSLVAERAGYELLGFSLPVLGLTVAHFHYAGFAAVLLAGLAREAAPGRAATLGAVSVPLGTAVVAVGHFTGRATELVGTLVLTTGLLATSWVTGRRVLGRVADRAGHVLLLVACLATPVTMALATSFALGRATGLPHLTIAQTAMTHGVLNAVGVGLCGLWAWQRADGARL